MRLIQFVLPRTNDGSERKRVKTPLEPFGIASLRSEEQGTALFEPGPQSPGTTGVTPLPGRKTGE